MSESKDKNWPPCYPIIRHDIQGDILEDSAVRMTELSYKLWLFYIVTLVFNFIAVVATAISQGNAGAVVVQILLSILYLILWPLFDFISRHLSLYRGFKFYFLFTSLDILFGMFIGIGVLSGGGGGLIAMINNFQNKFIAAGVLSAICTFMVFTLTLFHFKLIRQVYKNYKSNGWTVFPKK